MYIISDIKRDTAYVFHYITYKDTWAIPYGKVLVVHFCVLVSFSVPTIPVLPYLSRSKCFNKSNNNQEGIKI